MQTTEILYRNIYISLPHSLLGYISRYSLYSAHFARSWSSVWYSSVIRDWDNVDAGHVNTFDWRLQQRSHNYYYYYHCDSKL